MAWDVLSIVVGLVVGGAAVAIVVETMGRTRAPDRKATKLTTGWRLSELNDPVIVAHDVDVPVPAGATVFASGLVDPAVVRNATVHQVPPVRAAFAMDKNRDRALLFVGGAKEGALALLTVDEDLVSRLATELQTIQSRSHAYVERHRVADLPGRHGVVVETEGTVQDILPHDAKFMMRLSDEGSAIGVVVEKDPSQLRDERIVVRGRLERDSGGYPVILADDIRRVR